MKLHFKDITKIVELLKSQEAYAILFHGAYKSLIDKVLDNILQRINYAHIETIEFNKLCMGNSYSVFNNYDLFNHKKAIKITNTSGIFNEDLKLLISKPNYHLPVFIAGELNKNSQIRNYFEKEKHLISIHCYYTDDNLMLSQIIQNKIKESGKKIRIEALDFLKNHLKGDLHFINNEIDKLIIYNLENNIIDIDSCQILCSQNLNSDADPLCIYFASNNAREYFHALESLLAKNIPIVWVLRALIRFYNNLLRVKLKLIKDPHNIDKAVQIATPPIFIKYIGSFKNILTRSSLQEIYKIGKLLSEFEAQAKSSGSYDKNLCEQLFFMKLRIQ